MDWDDAGSSPRIRKPLIGAIRYVGGVIRHNNNVATALPTDHRIHIDRRP